jgi:hypothetical protein
MSAFSMATQSGDKPWQRLPKSRRAAVYRAFGRAIRVAREDKEPELAGDMRVAFGVLRAHATGAKRRTKKK